MTFWTTFILIPKLKSCILTYWHIDIAKKIFLTSCWHSEQLLFWSLGSEVNTIFGSSDILTYWHTDILTRVWIERLQNFDLCLYLTIFLSKYVYKEYRRQAHKNLSSSIVGMHEGTIFRRLLDKTPKYWIKSKLYNINCIFQPVYLYISSAILATNLIAHVMSPTLDLGWYEILLANHV